MTLSPYRVLETTAKDRTPMARSCPPPTFTPNGNVGKDGMY